MTIVIDEQIKQLIEFVAAGCTIAGVIFALLTRYLKNIQDPFLKYYILGFIGITVSTALGLSFTSGYNQIWVVEIVFCLSAFLATSAVVWRYFDVRNFKHNPTIYQKPVGFDHERRYLPYALLVVTYLIVQAVLIFFYTAIETNTDNRLILYISFVVFFCYLTICRIAWHLIDQSVYITIAKQKEITSDQ